MGDVELRYCPASWLGNQCDRRYDHEGPHHDWMHDVEWPRITPPGADQ